MRFFADGHLSLTRCQLESYKHLKVVSIFNSSVELVQMQIYDFSANASGSGRFTLSLRDSNITSSQGRNLISIAGNGKATISVSNCLLTSSAGQWIFYIYEFVEVRCSISNSTLLGRNVIFVDYQTTGSLIVLQECLVAGLIHMTSLSAVSICRCHYFI